MNINQSEPTLEQIIRILYIEDDPTNRTQGLIALSSKTIHNISAPMSLRECQDIVLAYKFTIAIIDFKLTVWVGDNYEDALQFGEVTCTNGIDLASYLLSINPEMQIGIFSSFELDLSERLRASKLSDKIFFISQDEKYNGANISKLFPDFVEKRIKNSVRLIENNELLLTVKPLFSSTLELPLPVQIYFYNKIISTLNKDNYLWVVGNYVWLAGANEQILDAGFSSSDLNNEYVFSNHESKFKFSLNDDYAVTDFYYDNKHLSIEKLFDQICNDVHDNTITPLGGLSLLDELFYINIICKWFVDDILDERIVIGYLSSFSDMSKFVSQKTLFKFFSLKLDSIESVYSALNVFVKYGFPKILDIYIGQVDSIDESIAIIKYESISPENPVRLEKNRLDFLEKNNLALNSEFEFTIYKPSIGGNAYHVQPI